MAATLASSPAAAAPLLPRLRSKSEAREKEEYWPPVVDGWWRWPSVRAAGGDAVAPPWKPMPAIRCVESENHAGQRAADQSESWPLPT